MFSQQGKMQSILPFLCFEANVREVVNFYMSVFRDSEIVEEMTLNSGQIMSITFRIKDQQLIAFNGAPGFKFTEAISLFVLCDSQEEVDEYWDKLTAEGQPVQCGWLKDKYGLSWQIVPREFGRMMTDKDPEKAKRAMEAMMKMVKLDVAELKRAYEGK